jgi:hypothetical protein
MVVPHRVAPVLCMRVTLTGGWNGPSIANPLSLTLNRKTFGVLSDDLKSARELPSEHRIRLPAVEHWAGIQVWL